MSESAADTIKAFKAILAEKNLDYYIVDQLVGEGRHGLIGVRLAGISNAFARAVDKEMYSRSSVGWSSADATIGRLRTGSSKHLALLVLTQRLKAR